MLPCTTHSFELPPFQANLTLVGQAQGQDTEDPVARAVREAIDAVAAPDVRVRILHRALHMAREHEIPPAGKRLEMFVERHLKAATSFHIGEEAAESVLRALEPIVRLARSLGSQGANPVSREHPTRKVSRATLEAQGAIEPSTKQYPTVRPRGSSLPMVLLITSDQARSDELESELQGAATVQRVATTVAFLDNAQATASLSPMIVFDCGNLPIHDQALSTIFHALPEDSSVLVWGASGPAHTPLIDAAARNKSWHTCEGQATARDVAALIHMLIAN